MIIKVYCQNALDGFSKQEKAKEYLAILQKLQPDIAFFSEAYKAGADDRHLIGAVKALRNQGYTVLAGSYDESDNRQDKHGMLLVVRSSLVETSKSPILTHAKTRNVAECWLNAGAKSLHFVGMHMNDRDEARRQGELDVVLGRINAANEPTIVAGDLNSLHRADARGKMFRKARRIHLLVKLKLMPIIDPTGQPMPKSRGRQGSIFFRLHEMASGKTIKRLLDSGLRDADTEHNPTYSSTQPFAQLDHILISRHFTVKKFETLAPGSSDHLGIVAELEL